MKKYISNLLIFIIVPLIFLLLVECTCRIIKIPKISHHNIYSKSQDLIPLINSNTILFLGDSRVEWGIKPIIIRENIKLKDSINVINLAMPNSNGIDILTYLKENHIFPKIVVLGSTVNYGRYTNHNLDKEKYSNRNRIIENIRYSMKQMFYVFDYNSILEFILGKQPVHKEHEYDQWGGLNVKLYGNYQTKNDLQILVYKNWSETFSNDNYFEYYSKIEEFNRFFSEGGTKFIGLSMPVSKSLYDIEVKSKVEQNVPDLFDKSYDYSKLYEFDNPKSSDSVYYMDGSHLTLKRAKLFSQKLAKEINSEID